ncbi:hypothetical protein ACFFX0_21970 [Citricoccus parietis]|uniref:Uncharacterized protein n=1 Tax=Citricoccus parietis TaxID=592307 RepID=A0ABV5G5J4_9MICC
MTGSGWSSDATPMNTPPLTAGRGQSPRPAARSDQTHTSWPSSPISVG